MAYIVTFGELLVEFVAARIGQTLDSPGTFEGPYPSGAPGLLDEGSIHPALFDGCRCLHIMGSSLFNRGAILAARAAVAEARRRRCLISFDPNIRQELMGSAEVRDAVWETLEACDLFLPSEADLHYLDPGLGTDRAIERMLERPSLEAVILKRGAAGSWYVDRERRIEAPAFDVAEIDPTGAGDCFCGTFLACRVLGASVEQALQRANAAGALAVTRRGPMEGSSSKGDLDSFIADRASGLPPMRITERTAGGARS